MRRLWLLSSLALLGALGCNLLAGGIVSCDTTATSGSCVEGDVMDVLQKQQVRALCDVAVGRYADQACSRAGVVAGCKYQTEFGERRTWYFPKATLTDKAWTVASARQECASQQTSPQLIDANGNAL